MSYKRKILLIIVAFITLIIMITNHAYATEKKLVQYDKNETISETDGEAELKDFKFFTKNISGEIVGGFSGIVEYHNPNIKGDVVLTITLFDKRSEFMGEKVSIIPINPDGVYNYEILLDKKDFLNKTNVSDITRFNVMIEDIKADTLNDKQKQIYMEEYKKLLPRKNYEYYIKNYDVQVNVGSDNIYRVNETMEVEYLTDSTEFIKYIPTQFEMNHGNGNPFVQIAGLYGLNVSDEYITKKDEEGLWVQINRRMTPGRKIIYKFTYMLDFGKDFDREIDNFSFKFLNDKTSYLIENFSFTIKMPKAINNSKIIVNNMNKYDKKSMIKYYSDGQTIVGCANDIVKPGENLYVKMGLPEGYFYQDKLEVLPKDKIYLYLFPVFILVSIVFLYRYGKNDKGKVEVQFNPPSGLNSAEVEYIYKGYSTDAGVISLIYELANKGYIKIEEKDTGKDSNKKGFVITKLKEYDGSNKLEEEMFKGLFVKPLMDYSNINVDVSAGYAEFKKIPERDEVTDVQLSENLYKTIQKIKVLLQRPENYSKIYSKPPKGVKILLSIFAIITLLSIHIPLLNAFDSVVLIGGIVSGITIYAGTYIMSLKRDPNTVYVDGVPSYSDRLHAFVFKLLKAFGLIVVPMLMMIIPVKVTYEEYLPIYISGFITYTIICVCAVNMRKRTKLGKMLYTKICGFRLFLEDTNSAELEKILKKNPKYYYDILPYMNALDISDVGLSKYVNILEGNVEKLNKSNIYVSPNDVGSLNSKFISTAKKS